MNVLLSSPSLPLPLPLSLCVNTIRAATPAQWCPVRIPFSSLLSLFSLFLFSAVVPHPQQRRVVTSLTACCPTPYAPRCNARTSRRSENAVGPRHAGHVSVFHGCRVEHLKGRFVCQRRSPDRTTAAAARSDHVSLGERHSSLKSVACRVHGPSRTSA